MQFDVHDDLDALAHEVRVSLSVATMPVLYCRRWMSRRAEGGVGDGEREGPAFLLLSEALLIVTQICAEHYIDKNDVRAMCVEPLARSLAKTGQERDWNAARLSSCPSARVRRTAAAVDRGVDNKDVRAAATAAALAKPCAGPWTRAARPLPASSARCVGASCVLENVYVRDGAYASCAPA